MNRNQTTTFSVTIQKAIKKFRSLLTVYTATFGSVMSLRRI